MLIIWFFAGLFVDLVGAQRGLLTTNTQHPSILQGLFAIEPIETVRGKEIVPKANRELQQNVPTFTTHATFPQGRAPQTMMTRQQSRRVQVQLREHPHSSRSQEVHSRKPTPVSVMQVQGNPPPSRNSNSHRGHRKMKHHHSKSFEINSDTEKTDETTRTLPTSNVKRPVSVPLMREKTRTLTTEARQGPPTEQEVRQRPKPTSVESASDAQSTLPVPSVTRRKFTRLLRKPKPPVTTTQTLHREHKHGAPTIPPPVTTTQTLRRHLMTSTSTPQSTRKHSAPLSRVPATIPPSTTVQMRATTSIPITRRVRPHLRLVTLPPGRSLKQFQGAEDSRQQSSEASSEKNRKSSHSRVPSGEQRDPLPQKKKLASEAAILEQDLIRASIAIEAQVMETRTESKNDAEVNRNEWALAHHHMRQKPTRKPKILRLTHNPSRSQSSKSDVDPDRQPPTVLNTDSEPGTVRVVNQIKPTTSARAQIPRTESDTPTQKIVLTMHPSDAITSSEPRTTPTSRRDQNRPTTTLSTHSTQKQSRPSSRKIEQIRSHSTLLPAATSETSVVAISRLRPTTPTPAIGNTKLSQAANTRSQPTETDFIVRSEMVRPHTTIAFLTADRALGESTISNSKRRPAENIPEPSEDRKSESRHTVQSVHPKKHKVTDDSLNFVDIPELQQDLTIYRNLPISSNVVGRQNVLKPQVVIPDRQAAEQSFGKFAIRMPVMPSIHSMTNELPFGAESSFRQRS